MVLTINGIDCFYDTIKILKNVNFEVKNGDFFGILGPNGSGKSTLLKSISRTLKPKTGTIVLDDASIYDSTSVEIAKKMAVVPQETSVAFDFTVLEIVLMGRAPHLSRFKVEGRKDLEIARKAMEYTGTWNLANRKITELSGGEKQRVIIAKALTQEPTFLLLDEPTSHLDISNQLEIMDILKQLCNEKKLTAVGVFHDFNLAARYCNCLMLMKEGEIVALGELNKVLTSKNIKEVFGVDAIVNMHPITGQLYVIPISKSKDQHKRNLTIHVISGAGTGSGLMKILRDEGFKVTVGVLNSLDTDHETANLLGIPVTSEAPLSPITDEAYKSNLEMLSQSNVLILTSVPFGPGNIRNLEAAIAALKLGIPTFLIDELPIEDRDFTKGVAKKMFNDLKIQGAITVKNQHELLVNLKLSDEKQNIAKSNVEMLDHLKPKKANVKDNF